MLLIFSNLPLSPSFVNWDGGGEGGGRGMLILTSPLYDPIHPHSDHYPHALIRTPSGNCATSSMPLLGPTLSFSGRFNPPLITRQTMTIYSLTSYLSLYFSLYFSSNYCITSPLSFLVTFQPFFLISHSLLSLSPHSLLTYLTHIHC